MISRNGWLLACDAEFYNRTEIAAQGADTMAVESEASLIAPLLRDHSLKSRLAELYGPFSIAAFDVNTRSLLVATDRFGMHPIVYAETPEAFIFASRIGPILATEMISADVLPESIFRFLYHEMIPTPWTIFKEVRKLPPGHYAEIRANGHMVIEKYWDLHYREEKHWSLPDMRSAIFEAVEGAVHRTLNYDDASEVAGAFLSGGTDSSTVSGMIGRVVGRPARTFSIGFYEQPWDETRYAHIAARKFGTEYNEYRVTPEDALDALVPLISAYDEPFGNSSIIPTYYCAKLAQGCGVEVMLAGDGGDELFAGNKRYVQNQYFNLYRQLPVALRSGLIEPLLGLFPESPYFAGFNRAARLVTRAKTELPERFLYQYLDYTDVLSDDLYAKVDVRAPLRDAERIWASLGDASDLNKWLYWDLKYAIADTDLRKVTTMCDLAGVRVRYPMLDAGVVAVSERIPTNLKVRRFTLRYAFKQAFSDFLPVEIIKKKKHGFGVPILHWLCSHQKIRDFAREVLTDPSTRNRGYVSRDCLNQLFSWLDQETAVYADSISMLWLILVLELWHRNVLETDSVDTLKEKTKGKHLLFLR